MTKYRDRRIPWLPLTRTVIGVKTADGETEESVVWIQSWRPRLRAGMTMTSGPGRQIRFEKVTVVGGEYRIDAVAA